MTRGWPAVKVTVVSDGEPPVASSTWTPLSGPGAGTRASGGTSVWLPGPPAQAAASPRSRARPMLALHLAAPDIPPNASSLSRGCCRHARSCRAAPRPAVEHAGGACPRSRRRRAPAGGRVRLHADELPHARAWVRLLPGTDRRGGAEPAAPAGQGGRAAGGSVLAGTEPEQAGDPGLARRDL